MSKEIKSKEEILDTIIGDNCHYTMDDSRRDASIRAMDQYAAQFRHDQFTPSNVEEAAKEYANGFYPVKPYDHYESDYDFRTERARNLQLQEHFKAGASYQSSLSSPVCGKWVKASERLPDVTPENETSTRFIVDDRNEEGYGKVWLMTHLDLKDLAHYNRTVKWLDESSPCLCARYKECLKDLYMEVTDLERNKKAMERTFIIAIKELLK